MASKYPVIWSEEAVSNLESILEYLYARWTQREVDNFKKLLAKQLNLISNHPFIFPVSSNHPELRKAVLSKQTIVFYHFKDNKVYLVYLFQTTQSLERLG